MKKKHLYSIITFLVGCTLLLNSCYKEDTNVLYSRQIVLAGKIKDLNDKLTVINGDIVQLQNLYNTLINNPVATELTYVITAEGDTLGANVTISNTVFYVPFGRNGKDGKDGKDGQTPRIGPNGNWIIGNVDTGIPARGENGKDGKDGTDGKDGQTPRIGENGNWFIGNTDTGIPAQGKDGADGKDGVSPTITISEDGYWVINGEKTNHKATGKDGKDGGVPIISAKQDPDNPADTNLYWTIQFPGETEASFIIVDGNKVRATPADGKDGKDGKDGAQGPAGPQGPQGEPGVRSFVVNIEDNGDAITITTINGDTFTVPLRNIAFKLKTEGKVDDKGVLNFLQEGQSIEVPYTSTDNLENIRSTLPSGWTAEPVISNDPTQRVIRITAPSILDIDRAVFEGDAIFYGLDEKGMVVTQFIKLRLQKYLYLNFFYHALTNVATGWPNSPLNELVLPKNPVFITDIYRLVGNDQYQKVKSYSNGTGQTINDIATQLYLHPSFRFSKEDSESGNAYTSVSLIYNPDSIQRFIIGASWATNKPIEQALRAPLDPKTKLFKPIPYNTYLVMYNYNYKNGSQSEYVRMLRVASKFIIRGDKFAEMLNMPGITKDNIDPSKISFRLIQATTIKNAAYRAYNPDTVEVRGDMPQHFTYDKLKDKVYAEFGVLGTHTSDWHIDICYEGTKKKVYTYNNINPLQISSDEIAEIFLNQTYDGYQNALMRTDNKIGKYNLTRGYINNP